MSRNTNNTRRNTTRRLHIDGLERREMLTTVVYDFPCNDADMCNVSTDDNGHNVVDTQNGISDDVNVYGIRNGVDGHGIDGLVIAINGTERRVIMNGNDNTQHVTINVDGGDVVNIDDARLSSFNVIGNDTATEYHRGQFHNVILHGGVYLSVNNTTTTGNDVVTGHGGNVWIDNYKSASLTFTDTTSQTLIDNGVSAQTDVFIDNSIIRNLDVTTGDHNDTVTIDGSRLESINVSSGDGLDGLHVADSIVWTNNVHDVYGGDIVFRPGTGNGVLMLSNVNYGVLTIDTPSSASMFTVTHNTVDGDDRFIEKLSRSVESMLTDDDAVDIATTHLTDGISRRVFDMQWFEYVSDVVVDMIYEHMASDNGLTRAIDAVIAEHVDTLFDTATEHATGHVHN